jgi:hypothetical protein
MPDPGPNFRIIPASQAETGDSVWDSAQGLWVEWNSGFGRDAYVARRNEPAPKPLKWEPVDLLDGVTSKTSRADLVEIIRQAGIAYNAKGREIVRLKNQSRKSKA